jgi:hypothetical protein
MTSNAAATAGGNYGTLLGNGTRRMKIRELGMFSTAATAANKTQLGRPAAAGTGAATTASTGQPQDPADAAGTGTWVSSFATTQPTQITATTVLRQWDFNNVVGSGVIFTWPSDGELVISTSGVNLNMCIQNAGGATGPISDLYSIWSE